MSGSADNDWVALVGKRDAPTDAVRSYCEYLAGALERRGVGLATFEETWANRGWTSAARQLSREARAWRGRWVLLQYTPLAWSRRGFPIGSLVVAAILRWRGARVAVVFHDWIGYGGQRWIDRVRHRCQLWTMRRLAVLADRAIFPTPTEHVKWLPVRHSNSVFIPIGANLPGSPGSELSRPSSENRPQEADRKTVAIYGVTEGAARREEVQEIDAALRRMPEPLRSRARVVVFGRGSVRAGDELARSLEGMGVKMEVLGLLPALDVARELARADVQLFVRGEVLPHRGSAIAGIACGIPVVGYGDAASAYPLSEGGLLLAPRGDRTALSAALGRVLSDEALQRELCRRSRRAQEKFFSWDRIAQRFLEALTQA